jgi:hypothetical protein
MAVHASTHYQADPHSVPQQLCGECASFAPLTSMGGGAPALLLPAAVFHERIAEAGAPVPATCRGCAAFRSRAPPTSL